MTNWHALPFELKTQVLIAYIHSLVHDNNYRYSRQFGSILVEHWSKSPVIRWVPSPKSDFVNLLLAAPELQQEILMLIQRKLSSVTILTERTPSSVTIPGELFHQPVDKELYMMSILKQQLANTGNIRNVATRSLQYYRQSQGFPWANAIAGL